MQLDTKPLIDAINRLIAKADDDLEDTLKDEGYVAAGTAVEAINSIEDQVTEALNDHTDLLLDAVESASSVEELLTVAWEEAKDTSDLKEKLREIFYKEFQNLVGQFTYNWILSDTPELAKAFSEDQQITKPTEDFISSWSSELAKLMHLSTNDQIDDVLHKAQKEKLSIEKVADLISESGIREPGYRARRVAVTEVLRMESYSQLEAMIQNPLAYKKRWIHVPSSNPRENHIAMDGQEVFKREAFVLNGKNGVTYNPKCPRDTCLPAAESINCHCIMDVIKDDNALGMTDEELEAMREEALDEVNQEWEQKQAAQAEEKIQWPQKGEKITTEQYKEVMKYSREKNVRLSGFKQFDGDIQTVKDMIDDVDEIASDFPLIREGKKTITIYWDETVDADDFAVTRNHIICINANAYRDTKKLSEEYNKLMDSGWFVSGTDYRSIIRHETGHVVENTYKLNGMDIAKKITGEKLDANVVVTLKKELSKYASQQSGEIISEAFSGAYSSGEKNEFALQLLEHLGIIISERS